MTVDSFDRAVLCMGIGAIIGILISHSFRLTDIQKQSRGMSTARTWGLTWAWNDTNRPAYVHNIVGGQVFSYPINYGSSNIGVVLNP